MTAPMRYNDDMTDMDQNDPSKNLMSSVVNDKTTDAIVDVGEKILDDWSKPLLDNELIQEIPIIKTVIGLSKGAVSFKEQLYTRKLMTFLFETSKASQEDKEKYQQKLDADPEECRKAGETIFNIIDKITNAEKAKMIGQVFRAFMHEEGMTTSQLVYLCEIIDRAHLQDIESLRDSEVQNESNLEAIGVRKPMRAEDVNKAILEAVNQAVEEATSRSGVIKEAFTAEQISESEKKQLAQVQQSGLTDAGYNLQRILRSY